MMFIGLIIAAVFIYFILAGDKKNNVSPFMRKTPEDILKERFINGEIDEKTYIQMKETLRK